MSLRKKLARFFFLIASLSMVWLILGMFDIVPFILELPNESKLRAHASITVILFFLASWCFWGED